jgi:hypothetical protein
MKFNTMLLLPIGFVMGLIACDSSRPTSNWDNFVTYASLYDSLPPALLQQVNAVELQGFKMQQSLGATTYYFEYTANHRALLKELSMLPFAVDSVRADTQCRIITDQFELKLVEDLLEEQTIARSFYRNEPLSNYTAYQCLKTPQHHFVLLSKNSDRVIHVIHQV